MLRYFGALPAGRRAGERNRINCRGCCDALRQSFIFRLPAECTAQTSGSERVGFSLPVVCILLLCFAEGGFCIADKWRKSVRFVLCSYAGSISETGAGCPCGDVWRRRRGRAGFFSGCSGCLCGVYCGKGRRKRSDAESGDCRAAENVSATGCREEVGMLFGTVAVGLHPAFEREKAFSVFMRRCGREPKRG